MSRPQKIGWGVVIALVGVAITVFTIVFGAGALKGSADHRLENAESEIADLRVRVAAVEIQAAADATRIQSIDSRLKSMDAKLDELLMRGMP